MEHEIESKDWQQKDNKVSRLRIQLLTPPVSGSLAMAFVRLQNNA